MKVTVLGCGSSGGVPLIGNRWGLCDPQEPRNRRSRASVLIEDSKTVALVDMTPDARTQLLACDLQDLTAVLFTHAHADHCHGIDELRSLNWLTGKPIDIFAGQETLEELRARFPYALGETRSPGRSAFYKPTMVTHVIEGAFAVNGLRVLPFAQKHGPIQSLGFRFGAFAYSTDVSELGEAAFAVLEGVRYWVVDAVRREPHPTHTHLARTLDWIARVRPERAWLTHMNETMDYQALLKELPSHVQPAHDGLVIEC
ncbi:MAG: MBL fold metallo-hydrolase [Bdellovibrionales bacterium]